MAAAPTPELAATIGDLLAQSGDARGAEAMYAEALRTGTADHRIRCHAAAIERALAAAASAPIDGAQCRFEQWMTELETE